MINQIQRKIQIPYDPQINYIGLLIGPKGRTQNLLEQEFGVKLLIRGKRNEITNQDDDYHLLIIGNCKDKIDQACEKIEQLFYEQQVVVQRQKMENLILNDLQKIIDVPKVHERLKQFINNQQNCYLMQIPSNKVGLVIGKGGQTIRYIKQQSGCLRISIDQEDENNMRYIFIEGSKEQVLESYTIILKIIQ